MKKSIFILFFFLCLFGANESFAQSLEPRDLYIKLGRDYGRGSKYSCNTPNEIKIHITLKSTGEKKVIEFNTPHQKTLLMSQVPHGAEFDFEVTGTNCECSKRKLKADWWKDNDSPGGHSFQFVEGSRSDARALFQWNESAEKIEEKRKAEEEKERKAEAAAAAVRHEFLNAKRPCYIYCTSLKPCSGKGKTFLRRPASGRAAISANNKGVGTFGYKYNSEYNSEINVTRGVVSKLYIGDFSKEEEIPFRAMIWADLDPISKEYGWDYNPDQGDPKLYDLEAKAEIGESGKKTVYFDGCSEISLEVLQIFNPALEIYEHDNFNGGVLHLEVGEYSSVHHYTSFDNDAISSLKVAPKHRVTVYEHADFGGNSKVFIGGQIVKSLNAFNWNDSISSIKIEKY